MSLREILTNQDYAVREGINPEAITPFVKGLIEYLTAEYDRQVALYPFIKNIHYRDMLAGENVFFPLPYRRINPRTLMSAARLLIIALAAEPLVLALHPSIQQKENPTIDDIIG